MKICDKFGSKEMVEAVNKFGITQFLNLEDYGFTVVTILAVFFEGVDILLEQDLIDIKMVDRLFVPTLYLLWERMRPVISAMREGLNEPSFFAHYEYLAERLDSCRKRT
jgi:hypothetical protein